MKNVKNQFHLKTLRSSSIFLAIFIFNLNICSINAEGNPDPAKAAEYKKFIDKNIEETKGCKHFKDPLNVEDIISKSKLVKDNSNLDDGYKAFAKSIAEKQESEAKFAIKSKAICDHIAETKSESIAEIAGKCRNTDPLFFQSFDKCDLVQKFLLTKKKDYLPEKASSAPMSKKVKATDSTCRSEGSITIDYEPCVKFAKTLELIQAGKYVIEQGQQAWVMGETQMAQAEASGKSDDPKAALGAMKTGVEAQKTVATQNAALESAKLATLIALYQKIPNEETLQNNGFSDLAHPTYGLLLNQDVKDDFKGEMVKTFGDAAKSAILAKIAGDQADAIGNAMAKVDSFKPIDFNVAQEDALVAYCQQHPEEAKCLSGNLSYNVDPFSGETIQFGNSGTGATYSNVYADDGATNNALNPTGSKSKIPLAPIGSVINGVNKDNTIVDKSGSASLGDLVNPQGGGGGGGGASGGGGFGGGGGAGGQKPGESVTAAGTSSKVSYTGGGGVSVLGNGLGIANRKSGKEEDNPFGALLNKNKGNGNGVLNLRGPASVGKKDGNIFEQISTKYKEVSANKERLLEYQSVP